MMQGAVRGLPDCKAALLGIAPKLRVRALRNALAAGARVVQRVARAAAPVISPSAPMVRKGWRKPGTVRKAISVRTSKAARRKGDVGVFVNVRPAKGAQYLTTTRSVLGVKLKSRSMVRASQRGAKSPHDPFYWRWIEFGAQNGTRARGFLRKGAGALGEALEAFKRAIRPQIAKLNRQKAPAP